MAENIIIEVERYLVSKRVKGTTFPVYWTGRGWTTEQNKARSYILREDAEAAAFHAYVPHKSAPNV